MSYDDLPLVLVVDDEVMNLEIIQIYIEEAGYRVLAASNGKEALDLLDAHPETTIIVLDRMMPVMDGMQFMAELKSRPAMKEIPVIMQTAAAYNEQVLEGMRAGVYYYLSKPYEKKTLVSLVRSAHDEFIKRKELLDEIRKHTSVVGLMTQAVFRFRTIEEARNLSHHLAAFCPEPAATVYGLCELMVNAIEHGNLGITYEEKKEYVIKNTMQFEISRRLELPENQNKFATAVYLLDDSGITITIKDQGRGFDWQKFIHMDPKRMTDPHGRGIATAKIISFSDIQYRGTGNEVIAKVAKKA
jgi:CheY-like chemotaxis protein